jgi:hypothetical protein
MKKSTSRSRKRSGVSGIEDVGVKRHDIATGVPFFRQRIVEVRIITRRSWLVWRQGIVQRLLLFF